VVSDCTRRIIRRSIGLSSEPKNGLVAAV